MRWGKININNGFREQREWLWWAANRYSPRRSRLVAKNCRVGTLLGLVLWKSGHVDIVLHCSCGLCYIIKCLNVEEPRNGVCETQKNNALSVESLSLSQREREKERKDSNVGNRTMGLTNQDYNDSETGLRASEKTVRITRDFFFFE